MAPEHLLRGLSLYWKVTVREVIPGRLAGTQKEGLRKETLFCLVGMTGFEPATSSSRTKRATKLRYIPIRCKSNFTRIADTGA